MAKEAAPATSALSLDGLRVMVDASYTAFLCANSVRDTENLRRFVAINLLDCFNAAAENVKPPTVARVLDIVGPHDQHVYPRTLEMAREIMERSDVIEANLTDEQRASAESILSYDLVTN